MACQLVADIGGTHARFAILEHRSTNLQNIQILCCKEFESLSQATDTYLEETNVSIEAACLAVACPVSEDEDLIKFTNNHWSFSRQSLTRHLHIERLVVINDFTAAAMATTAISSDNLFFLSENREFNQKQQRCIIGPGTGLGVAAMLHYRGKTLVLSTEGGHRSFSPENEFEDYLVSFLRSELSTVSCEELLSGKGLVNIYRAMCRYHQQTEEYSKAEDISGAAFKNNDMAYKALNAFFEILGSVAGDFALTFGAVGGVYIGGGIAPKFPDALLQSKFKERFENKLNYESYLAKIPTAIVMHPHPGLIGAAAYYLTTQ